MQKGPDKQFVQGPNRIFVFGSNTAGIHGAGAARTALDNYGAIYGKGEGLQGDSYALPTKNMDLKTMPLETVHRYVERFLEFAWEHPELQFFVTKIGCGLAGYAEEEIAPMFAEAPINCELPHGWRGEQLYEAVR